MRCGHKCCTGQVTELGEGEDSMRGWLKPMLTISWMGLDYGESIKAMWLGKCRTCIYVEAVREFI